MQDTLIRHTAVMQVSGRTTIKGLRHLDKEFQIRRTTGDEDDESIDQLMSVQQIMMNIKVGDTPVFHLVALNWDGDYTAFFRQGL